MRIEFKDIHVTLGRSSVLRGVDVIGEDGRMTGIVGPNGCGKSTLIKSLFGMVPTQKGTILLGGTDARSLSRKDISALVGYVNQEVSCVFDFTVREIVEMGLYARRRNRREGRRAVEGAIDELDLGHLSHRSILTLSGGERKMVFLARTIAQGVDTVLLDEPTNHLDIRHQLFIMNYLRKSGKTVLVVLHDLALAAHYCDSVYVMCGGTCLARGVPENVLSQENIRAAFGVSGQAVRDQNGCIDFKLDMDQ